MNKLRLSDIISTLDAQPTETNEALPTKQIEELNENFKSFQKLKKNSFNFQSIDRFEREKIRRKVGRESTNSRLNEWQSQVKKFREAVQVDFTGDKQSQRAKDGLSEALSQPIGDLAGKGDFSSLFVRRFEAKHKSTEKAIELEDQLQNKGPEDRDAVRREILRHRRLMVRDEAKAKRLKKIKSKMYRRIRRKHRERQEQRAWEERVENDREFYLEELEKMERRRADMRASTKHNKRNKFTRLLKKYGGERAAQEVMREIQGRRKEVLGKAVELEKLYGEAAGDEEEEVEAKVERVLREKGGIHAARQEVVDLLEQEFLAEKEETVPKGELFDEIMQRGRARTRRQAEQLVKKLKEGDSLTENDFSDEESQGHPTSVQKLKVQVKKNEVRVSAHQLLKNADLQTNPEHEEKFRVNSRIAKREEESHDSSLVKGLSLNQLKNKHAAKESSMLVKRSASRAILEYGTDSESNQDSFEVDARDMDENTKQLLQEKELEQMESGEAKDSVQMLGWGDWAGGGIAFQQKQNQKRKQNELARKKRILAAVRKRKDGKIAHVKINSKRIKDTAGLYLRDIPFEFDNKEQVNFVMSQPIGVEWNGQLNYKRNIRPQLKTRPGLAIRPLSKKSKNYKLSHF